MKSILTGFGLIFAIGASAQDSTKGNFTLSGSLDAYYRFNVYNAKDPSATNNLTSFTNSQNSFELGMASFKGDYTNGHIAATIDLGFGKRAQEFSYNDSGIRSAIKQAYISYAPSDHVRFSFGKWATHVGYEMVDAYLNRNYSMSYLFSYGPFFHTGIKAEFTFNNFGFMAGVANPTDYLAASFQRKFVIAQVSGATRDAKLKAYLNYAGGKYESGVNVNQLDVVVTVAVSGKMTLAYNGTVQMVKPEGGETKSWWGSAVYVNYEPAPVFGLTLRTEYFDDRKGLSGLQAATGAATNVLATTFSGNIRIDNLTLVPECRLDQARDRLFIKNTGTPVSSTASFILAALVHF